MHHEPFRALRDLDRVAAQRSAGFDAGADAPGEEREVVVAERQQGSFRRQIVLGEGLDADGVQAQYLDGVLRLTIPLAEASKPRRIDITPGDSTGATGNATG